MYFLTNIFDRIEDVVVTFFHIHPLIGPMTLLVAEEAGIPLPIPGDVYISYVGFRVSRGTISFHIAFIMLFISILVGSTILYFSSYYFGKNMVLKFGKFIHLTKGRISYLERKFRQYGPIVIILGRHVPGFRIPITVFAGISHIKYKTFILSEAISVIVWILIFMKIGQKLGKDTRLLFHNHYSFLLFFIAPVALTIITFFFGRFIPEDHPRNKSAQTHRRR